MKDDIRAGLHEAQKQLTPEAWRALQFMFADQDRVIGEQTRMIRQLRLDSIDAKRYRYLRDEAQYSTSGAYCMMYGNTRGHAPCILSEEDLDEAIDNSLAEAGEY